ncbi:MAG TPA: hypothetical protein VFJ87_13045 [Rhodanobacteraceae bacterium]|nr:hypothetical protein [Rhodanobacteraceae bacterium]
MKATHTPCRSFRRSVSAVLLVLAAISFNAVAACNGKLANLQSYAGKYSANADLLATPELATLLQRLPGDEATHLRRNLDVSGPVKLLNCHLVVSGNAPHMGTEQDAMLDVDLTSGTVMAAIHGGGRIDIYVLADHSTTPRWDALPRGLREWAVRADMGFPQQPPRSLARPGSVRLHAPSPSAAPASAAPRSTEKPLRITFDNNATEPTPAQAAAIRRAAGDAMSQPLPGHSGEPLYALALADLNDDGRADLIVQYTYASGACGSAGCSGIIVMATAQGYGKKAIGLPNFTEIAVLPATHHGMHDLQFDGNSPVWQWTGSQYDIPEADLPQSHMQPWKTVQAAGSPLMAYVTPIDSVIKRVLVACEQGRPLLLVLTKQPLPAGPATMTFVFRGWTVNAPLQGNDTNANLWMADLSRSQLPYWFAHRGFDANSRQIAPLVTESYLRINGEMQGQISMQDSPAATQAALSGCYPY